MSERADLARICKICHNVMLGVVAQCMAETTVLAERAGVSRQAFLEFLNASVMGSAFTRYKSPAFVNLDWTTTFTPPLLRKDLDLGLDLGRELEVPMPVAALVREIVSAAVGRGHVDCDFSIPAPRSRAGRRPRADPGERRRRRRPQWLTAASALA